jgi:hypothetical protein
VDCRRVIISATSSLDSSRLHFFGCNPHDPKEL